jgi:hypothetical protein
MAAMFVNGLGQNEQCIQTWQPQVNLVSDWSIAKTASPNEMQLGRQHV